MQAVIADDITGAAEIAGIGLRFGLNVGLVTQFDNLPECELLVCATDTRSMPGCKAEEASRYVIRELMRRHYTCFYKKTDSALRGHILPELRALMQETGYERALLIPHNPSRGRIVRDGIYYIDKIPLDQTLFAADPEFPALTANAEEYLKGGVTSVRPGARITGKGIFLADACNNEEIWLSLNASDTGTLFAGGGDLFTASLLSKGNMPISNPHPFEGLGDRSAIVICGSTANHSLAQYEYFKRKSVRFCNMPLPVFEGENPQEWIDELVGIYRNDKSIVVSINRPSKGGKEYALRLRNIMAGVTTRLVDTHLPEELVIEGGATAFAVLDRLGWTAFNLTDEIAHGVVRMALSDNLGVYVTLKPGSYEWGKAMFR